MTRTKIERVGGHLLIEGGSYTGEDNCQDVALPVATLRVENRNAREVFIWAEGDPLKVPNVIAHGWTAREVLEVAYGPDSREFMPGELEARYRLNSLLKDAPAGDLLAEAAADEIERQRDRIKVLEEALRRVVLHYTAEARNGDGIMEGAWDDVAAAMTLADSDAVRFDAPAIERGLASIYEAAGVER